VDFLSLTIPTQSKFVYPHSRGSLLLLYRMPKSSVPFTHLYTHLATVRCSTFGTIMNLEMKFIGKLKSGLVAVRYIELSTRCLYTNSLIALESVLVESFIPFSIGVDMILQFVILNLSSKLLAYFVCAIKILLSVC